MGAYEDQAESARWEAAKSQVIPSHVWTRLLGYDVDVYQDSGHNVPVVVEGTEIVAVDGVRFVLRPPGGIWSEDYVAPLTGDYQIAHGDGHGVTDQ